MSVLGKYYEESLYPLQNGVLSIVQKAETPFFLTGGTALSRYYRAYAQLFITDIRQSEIELKIEFINDVSAHYGSITFDPILGRIDSLENILSNKLTALFRSEPKDVVDIHAIALQENFNWKDIVTVL